eukprot:6491467-Amphidinium_carterae.2
MGKYHSTKGIWLKFDGNRLHAVEAVKDKGMRYSLTLFVPKYLNHLTDSHWQDLQPHGFSASRLRKMSGQANYCTGHSWLGLEDLSYLGVSGSNVNCGSIEIGDDSTADTLLMTAAGVATADPVIWRKLGNKAMITSAIKRIRQKKPKVVVVDAHLTETERSTTQEDIDRHVRSPLKP